MTDPTPSASIDPAELARKALDCIFRENEVPMSDRNGRLYDMVAAASGGAEPAVKVCCQQFGTCREPCCSRADYWQGRTEQLLREQGIPTVGAQVGAGSVVEPPAPQVKALAPGEFTFSDNSGLSTVCPWCENGFTILLPGESPAVAAPSDSHEDWFHEDTLTLVGWKYHSKNDGEGAYRLITPGDTYNPDAVTPGSMFPVYTRGAPAEQPTDTQDSGEKPDSDSVHPVGAPGTPLPLDSASGAGSATSAASRDQSTS